MEKGVPIKIANEGKMKKFKELEVGDLFLVVDSRCGWKVDFRKNIY